MISGNNLANLLANYRVSQSTELVLLLSLSRRLLQADRVHAGSIPWRRVGPVQRCSKRTVWSRRGHCRRWYGCTRPHLLYVIGGEEPLLSARPAEPPVLVLLRDDFDRLSRSKGQVDWFLCREKWSAAAEI